MEKRSGQCSWHFRSLTFMLSSIVYVQELFATLNENSRLEAKVQQLENELRNQVHPQETGGGRGKALVVCFGCVLGK